MKKILFVLSVLFLIAAGCNSSSQPANQKISTTRQQDITNWQAGSSKQFAFEIKAPQNWNLASLLGVNGKEEGLRLLSDKNQKSPYVDITIGQVAIGSNTCKEQGYDYQSYTLPNGLVGKQLLDSASIQKNRYICLQHNNYWYQIAVNVIDTNGNPAQAEKDYSDTINNILSTFEFTN